MEREDGKREIEQRKKAGVEVNRKLPAKIRPLEGARTGERASQKKTAVAWGGQIWKGDNQRTKRKAPQGGGGGGEGQTT